MGRKQPDALSKSQQPHSKHNSAVVQTVTGIKNAIAACHRAKTASTTWWKTAEDHDESMGWTAVLQHVARKRERMCM